MEILDIIIVTFLLLTIAQIFIIKKRLQKINKKIELNEMSMMRDSISFNKKDNTGKEEDKIRASIIQNKSPIGAIRFPNQPEESNQANSKNDNEPRQAKKVQ